MRVLDLFSGLGGWSQPFRDRGHEVFTVDNNPKFNPDLVEDVFNIMPEHLPWQPDIILASPPCERFSVLRIHANWDGLIPKNAETEKAIELVGHTLWLIHEINPRWWIMENPKGKLRKLSLTQSYKRHTVTYCRYGEFRQKPTDLWGVFPPSLELWLPCNAYDTCHEAVLQHSNTGTAAINDSAVSAKIPYQLALDVCLAAEKDLEVYNEQR